jgi:hypothetical protein
VLNVINGVADRLQKFKEKALPFRAVSYPQIESGFQRNGIGEHD